MSLQEKLEQAAAQYQQAQQQFAWWQERVVFLAGRIDMLQELVKEEQLSDDEQRKQ